MKNFLCFLADCAVFGLFLVSAIAGVGVLIFSVLVGFGVLFTPLWEGAGWTPLNLLAGPAVTVIGAFVACVLLYPLVSRFSV